MAEACIPVNGIMRRVAAIDEVVGGIIRRVPQIPVPVNGIVHRGYVNFDPTLPTYSQSLQYPNHEGYNKKLMTFVTRDTLLRAQMAGYTSITFTLSITQSLGIIGNYDYVGIGTNTTSWYNNTYIQVAYYDYSTVTGTFTLNIADMLATNEAEFMLVLNATTNASSVNIDVSLSNPYYSK